MLSGLVFFGIVLLGVLHPGSAKAAPLPGDQANCGTITANTSSDGVNLDGSGVITTADEVWVEAFTTNVGTTNWGNGSILYESGYRFVEVDSGGRAARPIDAHLIDNQADNLTTPGEHAHFLFRINVLGNRTQPRKFTVGRHDIGYKMRNNNTDSEFGGLCHLEVDVVAAYAKSINYGSTTGNCSALIGRLVLQPNLATRPAGTSLWAEITNPDSTLSPQFQVAIADGSLDFTIHPFATPSEVGGQALSPFAEYKISFYWQDANSALDNILIGEADTVSIGPCIKVSCSIDLTPQYPELGEQMTLGRAVMTIDNTTSTTLATFSITVSWSGFSIADGSLTEGGAVPPTVGGALPTAFGRHPPTPENFTITRPTGRFDVTGTYNGVDLVAIDPSQCHRSVTAYQKPYFKSYGGDVSAGDGFNSGHMSSDNCTINTAANIRAFARTNPPALAAGRRGGSTDFAGYVQGKIAADPNLEYKYGFFTGLPGDPRPNFLSFSNTVASQFGGQFGVQRCIGDWYEAFSSLSPSVTPLSLASDGVWFSGPNLDLAGVLGFNHQVTIVVDGDVHISSNISFQNYLWSATVPPPSFTLIARGNIYIDKSVTRIDGIYVAESQSDGVTDGEFVTCSDGMTAVVPANIAGECNSQLVVNGSVSAKHFKLLRGGAHGSLALAPANEAPTSTNIAEVFNYIPEITIGNPYLGTVTGPSVNRPKVESLISLPPIF